MSELKQAQRKRRVEAGSEGEWARKRGRRERKLAAVEGWGGGVASRLEMEVKGSGIQGDQKR